MRAKRINSVGSIAEIEVCSQGQVQASSQANAKDTEQQHVPIPPESSGDSKSLEKMEMTMEA